MVKRIRSCKVVNFGAHIYIPHVKSFVRQVSCQSPNNQLLVPYFVTSVCAGYADPIYAQPLSSTPCSGET